MFWALEGNRQVGGPSRSSAGWDERVTSEGQIVHMERVITHHVHHAQYLAQYALSWPFASERVGEKPRDSRC